MLKGISGDGGSGEVVAVDSGIASARGSACLMEWTAAELLDTTRGRTGGRERGYDVGTAAVASAMAGGARGGGAGEERGCLGGSGKREGGRSMTSPGEGSGEAASRCVARAAVAVGHLPACLAGKQLAGAVLGWAGRWAGAGRQVSFFIFFCFLFFNTSATLLNLIKYLGNFKNHQTIPGP